MNDDPEKTLRLKLIAKNFAQHAFINKGNSQLLLYPESQSEDEYEYDPMNDKKKGKEVISSLKLILSKYGIIIEIFKGILFDFKN